MLQEGRHWGEILCQLEKTKVYLFFIALKRMVAFCKKVVSGFRLGR